jgi:hypothetical protein
VLSRSHETRTSRHSEHLAIRPTAVLLGTGLHRKRPGLRRRHKAGRWLRRHDAYHHDDYDDDVAHHHDDFAGVGDAAGYSSSNPAGDATRDAAGHSSSNPAGYPFCNAPRDDHDASYAHDAAYELLDDGTGIVELRAE